MNDTDSVLTATVNFAIDYQSSLGNHTDIYHAQTVNFWRDIIPESIQKQIARADLEKPARIEMRPGEVLPLYDPKNHFEVKRDQFNSQGTNGRPVRPYSGRFYPLGRLKGVAGIFPQNIQPFRCLNTSDRSIEAELNHPLSNATVQLEANVLEKNVKRDERGGTCIDWMEMITSGSGMQMRVNGTPTAFFNEDPFRRKDENPDRDFYQRPRFVQHIDSKADEIITGLYGRLLKPGMQVLDLMTSWVSHIPVDLDLAAIHGLGMNRAELNANERLTSATIHDLNQNPHLPYDKDHFDAVLCTVSIEYLTQPFRIFKEVARVLKPGGVFVTTFSNRWFPPKAINLWGQIHEFERMGLVMEYFAESGAYTDLSTLSVRGFPRPYEDKYFPQLRYADPVYAVWGTKK